MKSVPRLIRRAVGLLFLCFVLLVAVNLLLLGLVASTQMENARPWSTAEEISATLSRNSIISWNFHVVFTCKNGNGGFSG